jgi:hypothetical protein
MTAGETGHETDISREEKSFSCDMKNFSVMAMNMQLNVNFAF